MMCGMLFVMHGSMVFYTVLANVEGSEMGLNEVVLGSISILNSKYK